jgi:gliding motility-associated-like protein
VIASQITAYHLSIYNRWGEILFESFDKNVGWDGTYNGTIVQNGTYIWTAVVSTNGTNKIVKNGHVNLIR